MCRGSEAVAAAEVQETVQTPQKQAECPATPETTDEQEPGDLSPGASSSDLALPESAFFPLAQPESLFFPEAQSESFDSEVPEAWCPSLPVRALQARLQGQAAPPRWAAWLPASAQQASYGNVSGGQMSDVGSTEMVSCDYAAQMMPTTAMVQMDMSQIDMSQTWVTPDGLILQPMVLYTGGDADNSTWADPNSMWPTSECYQYNGVQLGQEYAQLNEQLPQAACSIGPLTGRVWKLSQDNKGCRQVQDVFEGGNDQERMALAAELKGHVWQALKCGNANHVLQKCITTMKPASVQFIIDELTHNGTGGAAHAARHRFGCRIIERLLEHCSEEQMAVMVNELLAEGAMLSTHIYGYYVMQHLLEHLGAEVAMQISAGLEENLSNMAPDGYAGAVIGTALSKADNAGAYSLAQALLKDPERSAMMACSRWGHTAVKHALQIVDVPTQEKACTELMWYSGRLRSNRYGRLVAGVIAQQQNVQIPWTNRGIKNQTIPAGSSSSS